jgi:RimJ/RimL family protein N-acetyltransferase
MPEQGLPVGAPLPDWEPRPRPGRDALAGRYCRLEPLVADPHAAALFEAYGHDHEGVGWTYLPYGPFGDLDEFRGWVAEQSSRDDPLFFAILDAGGNPVGVASYLRINPDMGSIEVGHIRYSPLLQRTRAATEAMYLLARRAFDELGYRRYEWKCDDLNAASRRAAERLGFVHEGTFRQDRIYNGRNRDTAWYSITDAEWPAIRGALEAWLEPSNFDERGEQRTRLATPR